MSTHANQSHQPATRAEPQQKSASAPGKAPQAPQAPGKEKGTSVFHFADNRPKAKAQQSLQRAVNSRTDVSQLKAVHGMAKKGGNQQHQEMLTQPLQRHQKPSTDPLKSGLEHLPSMSLDALKAEHQTGMSLQLKATSIKHQSTKLTWKGASATVGTEVDATLNPNQPVIGSAVGKGKKTYTDIDNLVAKYNKGQWARGHLLNHDLGGFGVPENLFPITSGANRRHANYVEYRVKDALAVAKKRNGQDEKAEDWVHYKVQARGNPSNAQFVCEWEYKDKNDHVADVDELSASEGKVIIPSKLRGPGKEKVVGDPYGNSIIAPATRGKIWDHKERSGKQAENKRVTFGADGKLAAPLAIDATTKKSADGHSLADGSLTDEEIAVQEDVMRVRRKKTFRKFFGKLALRNLRSLLSKYLYSFYKGFHQKFRRKQKTLAQEYEPMVLEEVIKFRPAFEHLMDNDERVQAILSTHGDGYKSKIMKLIKSMDEYKATLSSIKTKANTLEEKHIADAKSRDEKRNARLDQNRKTKGSKRKATELSGPPPQERDQSRLKLDESI